MVTAYPLQWPDGWPRSRYGRQSRFDVKSIDSATSALIREIKLMGGTKEVLSTNLRLRNDGLPYSSQAQPQDKGAAIYFTYKGKQVVFACDRWDRIEDNIQALRKTIEALRGVERWGVSDMLDRAFTGFKALAAENEARPWHQVLEVDINAEYDTVRTAYRTLIKKYHPDMQGGNRLQFDEVQQAWEAARKLFPGYVNA